MPSIVISNSIGRNPLVEALGKGLSGSEREALVIKYSKNLVPVVILSSMAFQE